MRIFFSVGEPSGDLHGSNLIRRLKSQDPTIECVGYGGPKMAAAGCQLHFELTTLAVMFIGKAIANLRTFFRLIAEADDFLRDNKVDAVVLIDYPGFNWWIARKAKKHGVPVFYYGVPQVWAWASYRVRKIRRLVDHVLCKLPFEVDWFAKRNCQATYVGHPYFDQLATQTYDEQFLAGLRTESPSLLTLLPGSRDQEVEQNLPILLNTAAVIKDSVPDVRIVIACFNADSAGDGSAAVGGPSSRSGIVYGADAGTDASGDRLPGLQRIRFHGVAVSSQANRDRLQGFEIRDYRPGVCVADEIHHLGELNCHQRHPQNELVALRSRWSRC